MMKLYRRLGLSVPVLLLACLLAITGCSKGAETELERYARPLSTSDYGSLKAQRTEQSEFRALEQPSRDPKQHKAGMVSFSYNLTDAVNAIGGVGDARVFVADNIAYIGVVLDNTGQGMLKSKPSGERDSSVINEPVRAPMSIHNNPFESYLTVNDNSHLSDLFVQRVTDTVKEHQNTITEVHVSANKEFMYYIDEYAQVAWGGQAIDPYIDQFNILINHQFFNGKVMPTSLKYYRNR